MSKMLTENILIQFIHSFFFCSSCIHNEITPRFIEKLLHTPFKFHLQKIYIENPVDLTATSWWNYFWIICTARCICLNDSSLQIDLFHLHIRLFMDYNLFASVAKNYFSSIYGNDISLINLSHREFYINLKVQTWIYNVSACRLKLRFF